MSCQWGGSLSAPSRVIMAVARWEAVLVLREQAAISGHALCVRGATRGVRLLLRVEEPPACSPSSLHGMQVPRLVKVWLHRYRCYV